MQIISCIYVFINLLFGLFCCQAVNFLVHFSNTVTHGLHTVIRILASSVHVSTEALIVTLRTVPAHRTSGVLVELIRLSIQENVVRNVQVYD